MDEKINEKDVCILRKIQILTILQHPEGYVYTYRMLTSRSSVTPNCD